MLTTTTAAPPALDPQERITAEITENLRHADPEGVELVAPVFGHSDVDPVEADLTIQHGGEPIGERTACPTPVTSAYTARSAS
ncbi:hypothetical protein [Nocardioides humi]|uniref:SnoaL-like domain-containing protein n=1 Tax=Nocardioides humi TaxID=449461 RepID=A0ABN2ASL7_9ACTN|nr:hypothetical protein [Nocardioides humi]